MKQLLILLLLPVVCLGQRSYKTCLTYDTYKGKVNHGSKYCIETITIKVNKDSTRDTVQSYGLVKIFFGSNFKEYQALSVRGQYIVDSLNEDNIPQLSIDYLSLEPLYMKYGSKIEEFYKILAGDVIVYKYKLWRRRDGSSGCEIISETIVQ